MSLLTAVRDVAKTLSDLFDLTCTASRKMRVSDPTKEQLKMSTEVHVCFMHVRGCTSAIVEASINDYSSDQQPATKAHLSKKK